MANLYVQKLIYNISVKRPEKSDKPPAVGRALDAFGRALNKIGIDYATGLVRKKAILFTTIDIAEAQKVCDALKSSGRKWAEKIVPKDGAVNFLFEREVAGYICHGDIENLLLSLKNNEHIKSAEERKEWEKEINALILDFYQKLCIPLKYYGHFMPRLISYINYALPKLVKKATSVEELKKWGKEMNFLIFYYSQRFGNPEENYISVAMPGLIKIANSVEELREGSRQIIRLMLDLSRKFVVGMHELCVGIRVSDLLQKVHSVGELREIKELNRT
jgi:hypothetical protein